MLSKYSFCYSYSEGQLIVSRWEYKGAWRSYDIEFVIETAWRAGFFRSAAKSGRGASFTPGTWYYGDGKSNSLTSIVSQVNNAEDWIIGSVTLRHT